MTKTVSADHAHLGGGEALGSAACEFHPGEHSWDNAEARARAVHWVNAPNAAGQEKAVKGVSHVAMTDVAMVPVGQWYGKTAFRCSITGVLQGVSPYPWNVRPA